MEDNTNYSNRDISRVFGGLIVVGVGIALLLRNMGYWLPAWLFSWPVILVLIGIYSGVKHRFRNNTWIILIAIGSFFLVDDFTDLRLEPAFWPLIIIGIGILFILRPSKKKWLENRQNRDQLSNITVTDTWSKGENAQADKNDFVRIDSVFSGVNRTIVSKKFQGGRVACVFGGGEIDFSQADLNGHIALKIDIVFGGLKLIVPPHWTVVSEIDGVFHNVEDKRRYNAGVSVDSSKVLILKGSTVFGGVEIRSF